MVETQEHVQTGVTFPCRTAHHYVQYASTHVKSTRTSTEIIQMVLITVDKSRTANGSLIGLNFQSSRGNAFNKETVESKEVDQDRDRHNQAIFSKAKSDANLNCLQFCLGQVDQWPLKSRSTCSQR